MTAGGMAALVDVNVLIALFHRRHRHCARAAVWLETQNSPASVAICRVVQMCALRILTTAAVMRDDVLTAAEFWRGWDRMMSDDRFVMASEPPQLEIAWRAVTEPLPKGRIAETDTYLAAFAAAADHTLVTFDRGFRNFRGLDLELLSD